VEEHVQTLTTITITLAKSTTTNNKSVKSVQITIEWKMENAFQATVLMAIHLLGT